MGKLIAYLIVIGLSTGGFAQSDLWIDLVEKTDDQPEINSSVYRLLSYDKTLLHTNLSEAKSSSISFDVPMPDGKMEIFILSNSGLISPELQSKYPDLLALKGYSKDTPNKKIRVNYSPSHGFQAMTLEGSKSVFIDPFSRNDRSRAISYYREDFVKNNPPKMECLNMDFKFSAKPEYNYLKDIDKTHKASIAGTLRTYRFACAATGEYTQYHGGTVEDGLSAISTSLNRVAGIYVSEVGVDFELVGANDQIVFTDGNNDPFNNDVGGQLISESQSVIDDIIGNSNYDVGHTFRLGGGGLASLQVPCVSNRKARGITGQSSPIGDPFDVDYVSHELGHQFGAPHTFNGSAGSCSGNNTSSHAYEPGSGVTIMAYSGICSSHNIQDDAIPYFHTKSYEDIIDFTTQGSGDNCPTKTTVSNEAPIINAGISSTTIPISTPFELVGSATDPDNDGLTYSWEQFDLGPQGSPNNPSGNAPIFRNFEPANSGTRVFPQFSDLLNNTQTLGELLPTYTRDLTFRLTVKDDNNQGVGVAYEQISFDVTENAGPFLVTKPDTAENYFEEQTITVIWDVANTEIAPVNCTEVDVFLSTDGGFTYPIQLADDIPNNGAASVAIPVGTATDEARIKVKASNNIFFDISNEDFTIGQATDPDFTMTALPSLATACQPEEAVYEITLSSLAGFSEEVTLSVDELPENATANFSIESFTPNGTSTLTISNTDQVIPGSYEFLVAGTSISDTHELALQLIVTSSPESVTLSTPSNLASGISINPTFLWEEVIGAERYEVQLAIDSDFDSIVESNAFITEGSYSVITKLDPLTDYFWRVRAINACNEGIFEDIFIFQTLGCTIYNSTDIPVTILNEQTVESTINISELGEIEDLNVLDMDISHNWIGDLRIRLQRTGGPSVYLYNGSDCNSGQRNLSASFDDDAQNETPCPPTTGLAYKPEGTLNVYDAEQMNGEWTLRIEDTFETDAGVLNGWSLQVCSSSIVSVNEDFAEMESVFVYPNPASSVLNVSLPMAQANFTLYNTLGSVVNHGLVVNQGQINIQDLPKGLYHLELYTNDQFFKQKLFVD